MNVAVSFGFSERAQSIATGSGAAQRFRVCEGAVPIVGDFIALDAGGAKVNFIVTGRQFSFPEQADTIALLLLLDLCSQ